MATRAVKSKADYNTLVIIRDKAQITLGLEEPLTPDATTRPCRNRDGSMPSGAGG